MERNKFSKRKRRAEIGRRFLTGVALLGLAGVTAIGCSGDSAEVGSQIQADVAGGGSFVPPPNTIGLTIEGCNNGGNTPITPSGTLPNADGRFVCQDPTPLGGNDNPYTTGNLGKDWSELDLVPHRLTVTNSGAATVYDVQIAADYENGPLGYDVITEPEIIPSGELNGFSAAGCVVQSTPFAFVANVTGGAGQSIYRTLTITHPANSTCVVDFALRLAVGASEFPGASLQSYKFESEDFQTGKATISLPVNEIEPQTLAKDMTATQDTDFAWNITKGPMPASLNFGDTCDSGNDLEEQVEIVVEWNILPGMPGMVMVVTNIYATNPSSRAIRVDVSDEIFAGVDSLDVFDCPAVDVPPNTTQIVCTHVFDAPADVTNLHDTATATYIDVVTGVPVPGETTAMASAPIQPGTDTNTTAIITDTESISGNGLEYALNFNESILPPGQCTVGGSPYVPDGTGIGPPLGPEDFDLICVTDPAVEVSGSATASKIVTLDEPRITTGTLSDTADLTASDGFTTSALASVNISSNATVELTINKTIPDVLDAGESCTFSFTVNGPDSFEETTSIDFGPGEFSKSTTVSGGPPGMYTVTEGPAGGDCAGKLIPRGGNSQTTQIDLPACDGSVSFNNIPGAGLATAEAKKVTLPAGNEAGWDFTLEGPGGPITVTTTGAGFEPFGLALQEGDYTITEVVQDGWDQTMVSEGCSFTVDYPEDYGMNFQCTIENTQRGKIIVKKETDPDAAPGSFDFSGALNGSIGDGEMLMSDLIVPGSYSVVEADPNPGFDLVSINCDDGGSITPSVGDVPTRTASFELDPGETVTCTYTNRQRGMVDLLKLTNGVESTMNWNFTLSGPDVNASDSSPPTTVDFDGAKLIPDEEYTLCETGIPAGWTLEWQVDTDGDGMPDTIIPMVAGVNNDPVGPDGYSRVYDPNYVAPPGTFTNDTRCVNFVVDAAETLAFQIDNQFPGGEPRTIGYWKNWNTCTNGNQPQTAAENGGPAEGWFILDDLLNNPGYTIGVLMLDGADCEDAVSILDKRDIQSGKKKASDAAYGLAAQLLAAQLNLSAGAETCQAAVDAVNAGQALLASIGFDGTGNYLKGKNGNALRAEANALASTLDDYNNGFLCN